MRIWILLILMSAVNFANAQTVSDFETGRSLLLTKKYKEALPYFEKVMSGNDAAVKRTTINFIGETWLDHPNDVHISLSGEVKPYAKILIDYMGATFSGKEAAMTAADHYTAGLIFWSLGSSGATENTERALTQFRMAYSGGQKKAAGYFAPALKAYKRINPSVPWSAIVESYTIAAAEQKTMKPLTDLGWDSYKNAHGWMASKVQAERDTARDVFFETLNVAAGQFPDSLYKMVDYYHRRSFSPDSQDTILLGYLDNYLAAAANAPVARKAVAWNYLYKYFYDLDGKNDEKRNAIMQKIKAVYANDDKQVLDLIGAFFNETDVNEAGYVMSLNSKWLRFFSPMKVSDPNKFYYAAAFSETDFTSFISANGPITDYIPSIIKGYEDRIFILSRIITAGALNEKAKSSLGQFGTSINMDILKKLLTMPAFSNNSRLKHAYADMVVLNNFAAAYNNVQVPVQIDELPAAFNGWTAADKQSYNKKYFNDLMTILGKISKMAISDLDYSRLQKTVDKLQKVWN